jgi:hypothetical protein
LGRLDGKLVVVDVLGEPPPLPLRLAAEGAAVLVAGPDAAAVGSLVAALREAGTRAAGFVGDAAQDRSALVEMAAELFPDCVMVDEA